MSKTFEVTGITPGEWFASLTSRPRGTIYIDAQLRDGVIQEIAACGPTETQGQQEKNAALFVEAGTVANETGLTPRKLAEQRAELLEALRGMHEVFAVCGTSEPNYTILHSCAVLIEVSELAASVIKKVEASTPSLKREVKHHPVKFDYDNILDAS